MMMCGGFSPHLDVVNIVINTFLLFASGRLHRVEIITTLVLPSVGFLIMY